MSAMTHMNTRQETGSEATQVGAAFQGVLTETHWQVSQDFPFDEPAYGLSTGWRRSIRRDRRRPESSCLPAP